MDMKINKEILRRERELRAWTQSHLAEVADVSMRTVQRIERTGDTSMESASALAAALGVDLAVLMETSVAMDDVTHTKSPSYKIWSLLALIGSILMALGWWSTAAAEQVMLSLSIETGEQIYSDMMLLNDIGKENEIKLDDQFRMLFNTERQGEHLLVNAKMYYFADDEYELISSPSMLVKDQQSASLRVVFPGGQKVNLQLMADF
ncbi:MAG: hypothetical protein K0Q78_1305 [Cellvibrio sp.]|jgi:transcriptional regulator with XRE-family HTH domain|nr:hypothetical protein [Cellvibrio sp.]